VSNGLLLRSDIHRLFDTGYVSVSPEGLFQVSPRLKEDFNTGVTYYPMKDRRIILPEDSRKHPDRDLLRWHNQNVFIAA
jgi:putative restriction endonuclease